MAKKKGHPRASPAPPERLATTTSQQALSLGQGGTLPSRAVVVTPWVGVAAVARSLVEFFARLRGLGRLLCSLINLRASSQSSAGALSGGAVATEFGGTVTAESSHPRRHGRGMAAVYGRLKHRRAPAIAPPASSSPPPPLQVVGGVTVSQEVEARYREYCQRRAHCPRRSTICHRCIFEGQRAPGCRVFSHEMISHCSEKHLSAGFPCNERDCYVRTGTEDEVALHVHFCHVLPAIGGYSRGILLQINRGFNTNTRLLQVETVEQYQ
ncbi:hypothetical protein ACP70R_020661 [Stipagrostis hirtigluma subsp. patula]